MSNLQKSFMGENTSLSGGFIALFIIALVALGCTCNRSFDFGNLTNTSSNISSNDRNGDIEANADRGDRDSGSTDTPSNAVVEGLVKDTLDQFARAVDTKDFSELYDAASTDFKSTYTLDEMSKFFKSYTDKRTLVVPILDKAQDMDATFTREPSLRTEKGLKILMAAGEFKTKPHKVRFDFEYVMRDGEWKLLKLVINVH